MQRNPTPNVLLPPNDLHNGMALRGWKGWSKWPGGCMAGPMLGGFPCRPWRVFPMLRRQLEPCCRCHNSPALLACALGLSWSKRAWFIGPGWEKVPPNILTTRICLNCNNVNFALTPYCGFCGLTLEWVSNGGANQSNDPMLGTCFVAQADATLMDQIPNRNVIPSGQHGDGSPCKSRG